MKNPSKKNLLQLALIFSSMLWLAGCGHTVQGMKQDIHEASGPDQTRTTVVKKTTVKVVTPGPSSIPPAPLETPAE